MLVTSAVGAAALVRHGWGVFVIQGRRGNVLNRSLRKEMTAARERLELGSVCTTRIFWGPLFGSVVRVVRGRENSACDSVRSDTR